MNQQLIDERMTEPLEDEKDEQPLDPHSYRKGYAACINALWNAPVRVVFVDSELLTRLFTFWYKDLARWEAVPAKNRVAPPEIAWPSQ